MEKWITLFSDLCVIIFDLLLYSKMVVHRNDSIKSRGILYMGCGVIVAFYVMAVYILGWPVSISAFACMTFPSMIWFLIFSKYRDARFFLTFCFVDTVSLIVGFVSRYIGILLGYGGNVAAIAVMLAAFFAIYQFGKPHFKEYRKLLECIEDGWKELMVSAVFIYFTLIFTAAYPRPLIERMEYGVSYLVLCVMVLSFYVVFVKNIIKTGKVYEQSMQIKEQQKWFAMAYVDALTGISNRMAYMEKIYELERMKGQLPPTAIVVADLNKFKEINDTWGHQAGDDILKQAANLLSKTFCGEHDKVYRIGGDEFAVISVGIEEKVIQQKLEILKEEQAGMVPYSISLGYAFVEKAENNAVEQAFSRADAMMYEHKRMLGLNR